MSATTRNNLNCIISEWFYGHCNIFINFFDIVQRHINQNIDFRIKTVNQFLPDPLNELCGNTLVINWGNDFGQRHQMNIFWSEIGMNRFVEICDFRDSEVNSLFDSAPAWTFHLIFTGNERIYQFMALSTCGHVIFPQIGHQTIISFNIPHFKSLFDWRIILCLILQSYYLQL